MSSDQPSPSAPVWSPVGRPVMLLVAATTFMEILDGTIVSTAAPRMARALGVESAQISITITAYLVTIAALIPLSGWLAERWGSRSTFATAIAVFTVASALCATATSLAELVGLRILQGVGAAMMVPVGRLIVLRATSKADLVRTVAFLSWPALVAPIIAPLAGGLFTSYLSWRWIFAVNVPLGLVALVLAWRLVPQLRSDDGGRLDWLGFAPTAICLAAVVLGADLLARPTIDVPAVVVSGAVAALAGLVGVRHQLRSRLPLLDLRLLRVLTFRVAHLSGSTFRFAINAVPFLLPLMFQDVLGWSPVKSGAVLLSVFVGNLGIKPMTTWLLHRWGFRRLLLAATGGAAASILLCGFVGDHTPLPVVVGLLVISGIARSVGYTAYTTVTFADVAPAEMTRANTFAGTAFQLAIGIGVALGAIALRIGQIPFVPLGGAGGAGTFRTAFALLAVLTLAAGYGPLRLHPQSGSSVLVR